MNKLPIFDSFLSVGKSQAKTQVVFQAKTKAKVFLLNRSPEARGRLFSGGVREGADGARRGARDGVLQIWRVRGQVSHQLNKDM